MSRIDATTNFKDNNGVDLGKKLITKDYLISVYPSIGEQIGIPPELWTWGYGGNGRLGNGQITSRSTPVTTFAGGSNWKKSSSGGSASPAQAGHTAAIKTDGTLWTWGSGTFGRLGNAVTTGNISTPVTTFAGGTNWKQASCGGDIVAAIKTDGTLWTWGLGTSGALGNGVTAGTISTPITTFAGGTNWKQVSCGYRSMAAIKTDGTLWTWGVAQVLGDNAAGNKSTPITTFAGGNNWKQVSCGENHTAAIKTDGTLWIWGFANDGRIGNTQVLGGPDTPVTTFAGGTNWKQVVCAGSHTAAIKTDGTLWTWGLGSVGRLGNGRTTNASTPVTTFAGGTNWKQATCGSSFMAAIKTDGTLWTWGAGGSGILGNAQTTNKSTPLTTFAGGTNWKQVICAGSITSAIKSVDF